MSANYIYEDAPKIVVEPPGPKAREILERDSKALMQSYVRWYPLVIDRAVNYIVQDVDGNLYIDFNAGIAVINVGHSNPRVVKAIKDQAEKFTHYSITDFAYIQAVEYAERLFRYVPIKGGKKIFYTNSGTESVECTLKVSRAYHKGSRQYIIGFIGAFHGRTYGSLSITSSKPAQRRYFSPLLPGVIHIPYPYPYRCPFNTRDPDECGRMTIEYLTSWVLDKVVPRDEVASIIIEPIQGEGGYIVPPKNFMRELRSVANEIGSLLIVDEVQTGFGRTGKWFAIEHFGVEPDLIALGKAIANGLPLGACVGKEEVMSIQQGGHATTFGGNPVALSAALSVLDVIESDKLVDNAARVGSYIIGRLNDLAEKYSFIGEVRGLGLMIGIEIVESRDSRKPNPSLLKNIIYRSFKKGLLVIGAGESTLRISPPLTITREVADKAIDILEDIFKTVA